MQRGVEAVARAREGRLNGGGPQAGVDADEDQPRVRTDEVGQARVPERPISPNRPLLNAIGLLGGLGIGAMFAALLEFRDGSFRTEADVTSVLALPVLATVPELLSASDQRRRRVRRQLIAAAAVTAMLLLVVGAVVAWRFGVLSTMVGR